MTRITVVGDVLLDRDVVGSVSRIAPDAPVPVLAEQHVRDRPGGAGLAATLAAADGCSVTLLTAVGDDQSGRQLLEAMARAGVQVIRLPYGGRTPEKIRMISGSQVLLRLDRATDLTPVGAPCSTALDAIEGSDAIVVSDYGRGITADGSLRDTLSRAVTRIPVVWDPHPRGTAPIRNCHLVTPNEHEVSTHDRLGARDRRTPTYMTAVATAARQARHHWGARAVAVTLGPAGALLQQDGAAPLLLPATPSAGNPCGAGDRFATAAAIALAQGALTSEAVQAAVVQASMFVAHSGERDGTADRDCAVPDVAGTGSAADVIDEVRRRGGVVVATGGCFDLLHAGHIATLTAASSLGDCLIVCVNSDASVTRLKGLGRPLTPIRDRVRLLQALSCVDAVAVFDEPTPIDVLERLRPDIWVKGGDYFLDDTDAGAALPEADVIGGWGGQTVIVPYITGYSTTGIIHTARTGQVI
jgi:D-beta-D-heptose 7-phosphate kinase / D-beta-D-heptose 1-phosphate adenosyltransferase